MSINSTPVRALAAFAVLAFAIASSASAQQDPSWRPKANPAPVLVPPGAPTPAAAEQSAIAEVLAFERATEAAVVRGDTAVLERALAPSFLFTHGDGWVDGGAPLKVDTKASWIEWVRRQPPPYVYRELDHVQVELHGDVAITLGRYFYLPRSAAGAAHSYVWFERVYARRNGQWQQLSHRTVKGPVRQDEASQEGAGSAEEAAVRAIVASYVDARERRDAAAIGALFTTDADQFNTAGEWRRGREAIVRGTLASSERNSGTRRIAIKAVRFPAPAVAIADGDYEITPAAGGAARRMWTTLVLTRQPDGWRIAAIRNSLPTAPAGN